MKKKVLFIGGSLNQTQMMHKISTALSECDSFFTPNFADGWIGWSAKLHLTDFSSLGGHHLRETMQYIEANQLPLDFAGKLHNYDLVVTGNDLVLPRVARRTRLVLVQEGILNEATLATGLVRYLKLPRFLANTSALGFSKAYDYFCVASHAYRKAFIRNGLPAERLVATGIPNFDDAQAYRKNDFPYQDYVLVLTSSIRETFGFDDRPAFLAKAQELAGERKVLFKLHPNENHQRAIREIRQVFPHAPVFMSGNAHEMIANARMLIAQKSSAIFTAYALNIPVYSQLDETTMRKLMPLQNGGTSHLRIAEICDDLLRTSLETLREKRRAKQLKPSLKLGRLPELQD